MKKDAAYGTIWSLLGADAKIHGNESEYNTGVSGYFKYWNRHIDQSPVYFGQAVDAHTSMIFQLRAKHLQTLSAGIMSGNVVDINTSLSRLDSSLSNDFTTNLLNIVDTNSSMLSILGVSESEIRKGVQKYQSRLDK